MLAHSLSWQAQERDQGTETKPSSVTPGQGVGPKQIPSLPWVSVSLFVEGSLWHSSPQPRPAVRGKHGTTGLTATWWGRGPVKGKQWDRVDSPVPAHLMLGVVSPLEPRMPHL